MLDVIYSQKLKDIIIYKGNNSLAYKNIIISTANSNTQMNGVVKKITDILKDKSSLKFARDILSVGLIGVVFSVLKVLLNKIWEESFHSPPYQLDSES